MKMSVHYECALRVCIMIDGKVTITVAGSRKYRTYVHMLAHGKAITATSVSQMVRP